MKKDNEENSIVSMEEFLSKLGTTVIVAPHADDESLGCGGLISLLRKNNQTVYIILLSDGTLSHQNSQLFPAKKLMKLREKELLEAAKILEVPVENILFCRYRDRQVPGSTSPDFATATQRIKEILETLQPQSIFVPWRRDPHPDHRAAFELVKAAVEKNRNIYEYPIWLKELGKEEDLPAEKEMITYRLDIQSVLDQKHAAIAAHLSQTTNLISDDPDGFRISREMLDDFNKPYETFYTSKK